MSVQASQFRPHHMDSPHLNVLCLHGLFQRALWMENLAIHPRYDNQAPYSARVLAHAVPAAVALLNWPCPFLAQSLLQPSL